MKTETIESVLTGTALEAILYIIINQGITLRKMQADCMIEGGDIYKAQLIDSLQRRIDSLENNK